MAMMKTTKARGSSHRSSTTQASSDKRTKQTDRSVQCETNEKDNKDRSVQCEAVSHSRNDKERWLRYEVNEEKGNKDRSVQCEVASHSLNDKERLVQCEANDDEDENDTDDDSKGELAPIDEDGEGEDWDDEDSVGRTPRIPKYVETLTAAEIEAHNATHIPAKPHTAD